MHSESDKPVPADNAHVRAIVEALADWVVHRRASRDYGSLIGENEDSEALYENEQLDLSVVESSRHRSISNRRGQP